MHEISGWGRLAVPGREVLGEDLAAVAAGEPLTRGLGRAYGDAALPPPGRERVAGSRLADRILRFDPATGHLRAEAGLSLADLHRVVLPRGWFVPVSPGTEHVTLGGMVAADVHGKNHHRAGTIGRHLLGLRLLLPSGEQVDVGPDREPELFWGTVGGMGLTGHLLEVELALEAVPSPWLRTATSRFADLAALTAALREEGRRWPFTAAWVDGLGGSRRRGRGVLLCGRWAQPDEAPSRAPRRGKPLPAPPWAPESLLDPLTVGLFNSAYYWRQGLRRSSGVAGFPPFFYPLDGVDRWSRLYGKRGMTQYQCVLPEAAGAEAVPAFLELVRQAGGHPYLIVLKDFGAEGRGLLSFPQPGYTLALDFAVGPEIQALIDRLNARLRELGGRIYLAKDAFTRREDFAALEGERLERFRALRRRVDPQGRLASRLSVRLGL